MSITTFLLRLVGRSPEQVLEQERFERNLRELDERGQELDQLLEKIRGVDQVYQEKKATCEETARSVYPPGDQDVRINFSSDPDLSDRSM